MKNPKSILSLVLLLSIAAAIFTYTPLWSKISSFRPWLFGLDIAGGAQLTYDIDLSEVALEDRAAGLEGLRDVIERRVNFFGVSEPRVYLSRNDAGARLIVELAGVKNIQGAIDQIGATPFLDFREVAEKPAYGTTTESGNNFEFTPTALSGRFVERAQVVFDPQTNAPSVSLSFSKEGAAIFADLTRKNLGRPIAVFLDNSLITMPVVNQAITGGQAEITGNFTPAEAKQLADRFNAGALPAPITLVDQRAVSPELGERSLARAIQAGAVGALLVIAFMIAYYKRLGIYSALALLAYIALTLAVLKIIPITLTLSGIAGFVLSVGMAVDANILVFERIKEEQKRGLAPARAIDEGFRRAWPSIRDSNVSTVITSIILYYFTSSFVRGFALTLLIGVLMSMFSALTITRAMLKVAEVSNASTKP